MGQVELTGQFRQSGGVAFNRNATVRGRVTRVQVRTTPYHHREGAWQPVPDSPSTYHDVDEAPRWFDRGGMDDADPGSDAVFSVQTGVMIDLDLDDVDPPPPRPRIEPESVAAGDHGIWVVDNQLPVAVLLAGDTATEYVFPGTITSGRTILATPTGCTITEGLETYHCTVGEPIHKPTTVLPHVALGDVSLRWERVDNTHWRALLTSSTGEQVAVIDLPTDQQLRGMVTDSGAFVVAVQDADDSDQTVRLMRITTAGEVTRGPAIPIAPRQWIDTGNSLFHTPLRFRQGKDMYPINSDLSAGEPVRLPDSPLTAGQTATTAWISTHPPSQHQPTGPASSGRSDHTHDSRSRRQFWVVTLLDADSQPFVSFPTSSPTPALTTDHHGRHWITDHGLRPLPTDPMTWSDPINLDAAITTTIYPSPPP
ncbi:hypothetical protein [Gordonia sp. NPDC127522]|uniref:hypothetical protein n=1 Tax=Gordonia sp. NPDC127522 TaxID=3345390 RepID=UPI003628FB42